MADMGYHNGHQDLVDRIKYLETMMRVSLDDNGLHNRVIDKLKKDVNDLRKVVYTSQKDLRQLTSNAMSAIAKGEELEKEQQKNRLQIRKLKRKNEWLYHEICQLKKKVKKAEEMEQDAGYDDEDSDGSEYIPSSDSDNEMEDGKADNDDDGEDKVENEVIVID